MRNKAIFRKGLKKGHLLAYTGVLGKSLRGLEILQNGGTLNSNHVFIKPKLRPDFFMKSHLLYLALWIFQMV